MLEEIGGEYARRGELAVALSYYEKAVKTAETLGDAAKTIGALIRLRDLYAAVGNTTRSAEFQREIDQLRK